jgi:uncharacterized DUF497 family protein
MRFTWDKLKNTNNLQKHGVSFETAQHVFSDPYHLTRQDRIENGEARWQTMGLVGGIVVLLVAHTWSDDGDNAEHIRIISARKADPKERKIYEKNH